MLSFLIQLVAYFFFALSCILLLMQLAKGKGKSEEKIKHLEEAARANKEAADARRTSSHESERGGLRDNDGFRRD
jgi:hypothetical protein